MPLTALMRNLSIGASADITRSRLYLTASWSPSPRWGSRAISTGPIWTGRIRLSLSCSGSNRRSTRLPDSVATALGGILLELLRYPGMQVLERRRFTSQAEASMAVFSYIGRVVQYGSAILASANPQSHMSRCSRHDIRGRYVVDFGQRRIEAAPNYTASNLPNWSVARVPDNSMVGAPGLEPATR
jgi:hypothetical protein